MEVTEQADIPIPKDETRKKRNYKDIIKRVLDQREKEIEGLLFGSQSSFLDNVEASEQANDGYITTHILGMPEGIGTDALLKEPSEKRNKTKEVAESAWEDDDDEDDEVDIVRKSRLRKLRKSTDESKLTNSEYEKRLREQHAKLNSQSLSWTEPKEGDTVDVALRSTKRIVLKRDQLEPTHISLSQMRDANNEDISKAVVQCCEFHKSGDMILTAGLDKTLRLFQIDGKKNPKLQGMHFQKFPITSAHFTPDGKEVILSGKDKSFFVYDITTGHVDKIPHLIGVDLTFLKRMLISPDNKYIVFLGENSQVYIVSNKTKQLVHTLNMSGEVTTACFTSDGTFMYVGTDRGTVFVWELNKFKCVQRFQDEGCLRMTAIAISHDNEYLATGQESGVVNIYHVDDKFKASKNPKPSKSLLNITTPISILKFNSDSQLLGMASSDKRNSLRLVHLPSMTVYNNWPKETVPLGRVSSFDFSPDSGYLIVGNVRGNVRLFKLHHYHTTSDK